ncbi:MAG: rhodanese-like domain-containing protein [Bacteroidia bacterium]|nr:rhodanese-like domain-containing protein [Bacteroidia bacterium]
MNNAVKELLHLTVSINYKDVLKNGGKIIDVRSHGEYMLGHINKSINIPFEELPYKLDELDRSKTMVLCCANGFRSASAKTLLEMHGFTHVINAGPWIQLNNEVQ